MAQTRTFVGLDTHARKTQIARLDFESGELRNWTINGRPTEALSALVDLPGPLIATYEAGPTGYGLARAAADAGIQVRVCAPGAIHKKPNDKIKTDRRDAERLARLLAAGELSFVRVPTIEEEYCRDLSRCREAARKDLMRARHRLSKFLARREIEYEGSGNPWSWKHQQWLHGLRRDRFDDLPSKATFADYLSSVEALTHRRDTLTATIEEHCPRSPWAETIARLRCMRGIDSLTAFGLCAEIGDFGRFSHPSKLSAYLGIVPSEYSSGESKRRGPITKAGSTHARRLLVEAAHHYWREPSVNSHLARRQKGQDPRAVAIGWRCQVRLHNRYRHLRQRRAKRGNVTVISLARELNNFVWEVARLD